MRSTAILFLLFMAAATAWCAEGDTFDGAAVLQRLRTNGDLTSNDLMSFVCDESIRRFRSALDGTHVRTVDTVEASLSFENGAEHYSNIRQNALTLTSLSTLSGAWSEGEFGTLLRQTHQLLRVEPVTFGGVSHSGGDGVLLYSFDVPAQDSPWELVMDGHSYRLAFHTDLFVNAATEQIMRVVRTASHPELATGISDIRWSLALQPVRLLGKEWLLPATAQYSVRYAHNNRREWNEIDFGHYRRYGSEVALRFDAP